MANAGTYTDKTSNVESRQTGNTGNVAMTGLSWAGTTTLVWQRRRLKTIVPAAESPLGMIISIVKDGFGNAPYSDLSWLSLYVSTRMLDQRTVGWYLAKIMPSYINQLNKDQNAHEHQLQRVWRADYTLHPEKFKTSASWFLGLNDDNVKPSIF